MEQLIPGMEIGTATLENYWIVFDSDTEIRLLDTDTRVMKDTYANGHKSIVKESQKLA